MRVLLILVIAAMSVGLAGVGSVQTRLVYV